MPEGRVGRCRDWLVEMLCEAWATKNRKILKILSSNFSFLLYPQGKTGEPGLPGPEGARGPPVSA